MIPPFFVEPEAIVTICCRTCGYYQPPERAAPRGVLGTCHEPGNLVGRPTGVYAVSPGEKCANWKLTEGE